MRDFGLNLPEALLEPVKACRAHVKLAALLSALVNILYLAPTLYMMQVYDRVVSTGGVVTLMWLTLVVAFALGTLAALDALRSRIMVRAGLRLDRMLASEILDRILRQPKRGAETPTSSQALREFDSLRQAFSGPPAIAMFDVPWTPIYIGVAFLLHPWLGVMALISGLLLLGIAIQNERATRVGAKLALRTMSSSYATQERLASQSEVVRALGMRGAMLNLQLRERRRGLEQTREQQFQGGSYAATIKFLRLFLQSAALGLGAWLAIENQISAGAIIAASVLLSRTLQPIEQIVGSWKSLLEARQAVENLGALFASTDMIRAGQFDLPAPKGAIACEQITVLGAQGSSPALSGVSFAVKPGEFVGVIGPSGAGKSTLLRVLAGAISADRGFVRIDGAEIHDWDQDKFARHIGYLPQDCALLPGSVAENISRFATAAGDDPEQVNKAVLEAAHAAGVHDAIVRLPGGYDMRIGWNGEGLSAGQKQRITLARAMFGNPSILIMDEPNASLDAIGEEALVLAIQQLRERGATVFVAAHRQSILATASSLLFLIDGVVKLFGPTADVMEQLNPRPVGAKLVEVKAS
jgi:PrtD family type I secretion system ABC transporter